MKKTFKGILLLLLMALVGGNAFAYNLSVYLKLPDGRNYGPSADEKIKIKRILVEDCSLSFEFADEVLASVVSNAIYENTKRRLVLYHKDSSIASDVAGKINRIVPNYAAAEDTATWANHTTDYQSQKEALENDIAEVEKKKNANLTLTLTVDSVAAGVTKVKATIKSDNGYIFNDFHGAAAVELKDKNPTYKYYVSSRSVSNGAAVYTISVENYLSQITESAPVTLSVIMKNEMHENPVEKAKESITLSKINNTLKPRYNVQTPPPDPSPEPVATGKVYIFPKQSKQRNIIQVNNNSDITIRNNKAILKIKVSDDYADKINELYANGGGDWRYSAVVATDPDSCLEYNNNGKLSYNLNYYHPSKEITLEVNFIKDGSFDLGIKEPEGGVAKEHYTIMKNWLKLNCTKPELKDLDVKWSPDGSYYETILPISFSAPYPSGDISVEFVRNILLSVENGNQGSNRAVRKLDIKLKGHLCPSNDRNAKQTVSLLLNDKTTAVGVEVSNADISPVFSFPKYGESGFEMTLVDPVKKKIAISITPSCVKNPFYLKKENIELANATGVKFVNYSITPQKTNAGPVPGKIVLELDNRYFETARDTDYITFTIKLKQSGTSSGFSGEYTYYNEFASQSYKIPIKDIKRLLPNNSSTQSLQNTLKQTSKTTTKAVKTK